MAHSLSGGDTLARGGHRAQFSPSGKETTEKWTEAFGKDNANLNVQDEAESAEQERLILEAAEQIRLDQAARKAVSGAGVPFRAVQDRIVVARIEEEAQVNGLYVPDEGKEKPAEGIVVATGPGIFRDGELQPVTIRVGERVMFGKYAGVALKVGFQEFLVLREEDIFIVKTPQ